MDYTYNRDMSLTITENCQGYILRPLPAFNDYTINISGGSLIQMGG